MVTETELAEKVNELLTNSDLKKTTNTIVRKKLETHFSIDLSNKKAFVRDLVDKFLQSHYDISEEEGFDSDRDDYGNDDVSDSDDDFYHQGSPQLAAALHSHSNGNNNNHLTKPINKFERPGRRNKENKKRGNGSGKFCTLSPQLQKFLGVSKMARTEVVKQLWNYVREKNLQDPVDGKNIICDETLRDLFGVDTINILQINKALTKHIWPPAKSIHKDKRQKQERGEDPDGTDLTAKRQRKVYSGFLAPLRLSDTLIKFLGTTESALTRADVIKRVWEYIKDKNLQDPCDKKTVLCDEKLRELFNVDSFHGFTVSKLLTAHFEKT